MEKLTFNKRIALTKKEVFDLVQSENLDKAGNCKSGYYSIKTIMTHLNNIMDKYDIDIDVIICGKVISCIWVDCLSEMTRVVPIELKELSEIEKLPAMQNIIQSEGAILTYYRRYAITNCLNLNATDLIENNTNVNNNQKQNTQQNQQNNQQKQQVVNEKQLKMLFAIMSKKGKTEEDINKYIKAKRWNINSKKELNNNMFNELVKALEKYEDIK
jgi:ERF superfamily